MFNLTSKVLAQDITPLPGYSEIKTEEGESMFTKFIEKFTDEATGKITLGAFISALFPYLFTLAGLGLFLYLIIAGFGFLTSAGDPKKTQSAKDKLTNAVIGFIIIFVAYWLILILEKIFGLDIFG